MSNGEQDPYHFNHYNNHQNLCFEPSSYNMTFTDFLHGCSMGYSPLPTTFDMSCSSSGPVDHGSPRKVPMLGRSNNNNLSSVQNGSVSSSSTEAATEEDSEKSKRSAQDQAREDLDEADKSKKVCKSQKKEKREKQPRFAFLTKSEIDHLEDGYKWRKYGQKAVKNSSYPRSYYRCTTQKCGMKKRVERSFEDPTVVITTYEGQHNHQCPLTLRGSSNAGAFLPPSFSSMPPSFLQDFLSQLHHPLRSGDHQQQLHVPDYGMLQDLIIPHKHKDP